jgi:hypothetical protein
MAVFFPNLILQRAPQQSTLAHPPPGSWVWQTSAETHRLAICWCSRALRAAQMSCATRALVVASRSQHHNVQGCGPRSGYNARAVPSVGRPLGGRRAGQQPLRAAKGEPEANPAEGGVPPGSSGPTGGGGGGGGNGSGAAGGAILAGRALESLPAGGWGSGMTASDVASRRSFRPGRLAALSGMLNHHCLPARLLLS